MYPIPSKYYWSGWRQVSTYIPRSKPASLERIKARQGITNY